MSAVTDSMSMAGLSKWKRQLSRQNGKGLPQEYASCSWKGKKRMDTCAFLRGYPVKEGIILG